jgi:cell fate regulator YaaT (PSP1 superfamily)
MYLELKKNFPKVGKRVTTPQGEGKVIKHSALTGCVTVLLDEGKEVTLPIKDVTQGQTGQTGGA